MCHGDRFLESRRYIPGSTYYVMGPVCGRDWRYVLRKYRVGLCMMEDM